MSSTFTELGGKVPKLFVLNGGCLNLAKTRFSPRLYVSQTGWVPEKVKKPSEFQLCRFAEVSWICPFMLHFASMTRRKLGWLWKGHFSLYWSLIILWASSFVCLQITSVCDDCPFLAMLVEWTGCFHGWLFDHEVKRRSSNTRTVYRKIIYHSMLFADQRIVFTCRKWITASSCKCFDRQPPSDLAQPIGKWGLYCVERNTSHNVVLCHWTRACIVQLEKAGEHGFWECTGRDAKLSIHCTTHWRSESGRVPVCGQKSAYHDRRS